MNHDSYPDAYIAGILARVRSVAVVGYSANPARASSYVSADLHARGYDVIPVNPGLAGTTVMGMSVVASLGEAPRAIDMVDVFRNSEAAGGVVDEALALDPLPHAIWMQLGVRDDAAARRAEARDVRVVMDRCPKIELVRLRRLIDQARAEAPGSEAPGSGARG